MKKYERRPLPEIIAKYGIKGVHPAAGVIPLMTDEEFQSLCADVEANGFWNPVTVTDDGILIDGRNRVQAAWAVGKDPIVRRYNPSDVFVYLMSENFFRTSYTKDQLAAVDRKTDELRRKRGNPVQGDLFEAINR
jgi:ParB-like chromosome segregation protein Spo0J